MRCVISDAIDKVFVSFFYYLVYTLCSGKKTPTHIFLHISMSDV